MVKKEAGFIEIFFIGGVIIFLFVITFIYWFVAQPYRMSGSSLLPTLVNGEYFMVNKLDREFKRGDIVVFRNPSDDSQDFVKRITAVPGDKIKIASGEAFLNGTPLTEFYLKDAKKTQARGMFIEGEEILVPDGEYIMLGDNREYSVDSRDYGFIKNDQIIGKYWFSYYK
jgi:signal peptidase I